MYDLANKNLLQEESFLVNHLFVLSLKRIEKI